MENFIETLKKFILIKHFLYAYIIFTMLNVLIDNQFVTYNLITQQLMDQIVDLLNHNMLSCQSIYDREGYTIGDQDIRYLDDYHPQSLLFQVNDCDDCNIFLHQNQEEFELVSSCKGKESSPLIGETINQILDQKKDTIISSTCMKMKVEISEMQSSNDSNNMKQTANQDQRQRKKNERKRIYRNQIEDSDDDYNPSQRKKNKRQCDGRNFISNLKKHIVYYMQNFGSEIQGNQSFQRFKNQNNKIMHETLLLFEDPQIQPYLKEMFLSRFVIRQYQLSKTARGLLKLHFHEFNRLKKKFIMICQEKRWQFNKIEARSQQSSQVQICQYNHSCKIFENSQDCSGFDINVASATLAFRQ